MMGFMKRMLNPWSRRKALDELHDAEMLNRALVRERKRIDRRGGAVSLLTFEILAGDERARLERLATVLARRLRETDIAGLLRPDRLAIVLPDTPQAGAEKLAHDLRAAVRMGPAELKHEIVEYSHSPGGGSRSNGHTVRPPEELAELPEDRQTADAIFCAAVPRWKRAMDIVGALVGLALTSPVILVAALLVKLTSPGPAFFVQNREGRGGRVFRMYKLRTMYMNAERDQAQLIPLSEQDGPAFKMKNDPRLTRIGKFLRKTSIDELPQLVNVLRGEMSLVGPRPLPYRESVRCEPWQRQRLQVNPGMTCIWQVRARSSVSFVQWVRMDLQYVRQMSPLLDAKLLLQTLFVVLLQRGAH